MSEKLKKKNLMCGKLRIVKLLCFTIAPIFCLSLFFALVTYQQQILHQKLAERFSIMLPNNAWSIYYWEHLPASYMTLARFSVYETDLESIFETSDTSFLCFHIERISGVYPKFYSLPSLFWWNPQEAKDIEGINCACPECPYQNNNMSIMVDFTREGEAIVYIQAYTTRFGEPVIDYQTEQNE